MRLMTVREAATMLDCSEAYVRDACDRGLLGESFGNGRERKAYKVFPALLAQMLGISVTELEGKVNR